MSVDKVYKREGPCICTAGRVVQIVVEGGFLPARVAIPSLMCEDCAALWHIDHAVDDTGNELKLYSNKFAFVPNSLRYRPKPRFPEKQPIPPSQTEYLIENFSKSVLVDAREQFDSITNCGKATGVAKKVIYGLKKYFHSAKRADVILYLDNAIRMYSNYLGKSWDEVLDEYDADCREYRQYLRVKKDAEKPTVILGDKIRVDV